MVIKFAHSTVDTLVVMAMRMYAALIHRHLSDDCNLVKAAVQLEIKATAVLQERE